jgi:hypothetical protein
VLFHDRARGYFLSPSAVAAGALRALFDVFILALFFAADAAQVFSTWHVGPPQIVLLYAGILPAVARASAFAARMGNGQAL